MMALFLIILVAAACQPNGGTSQNTIATASKVLIIYDWDFDLPQEVLDKFHEETGIVAVRRTYSDQLEAIENLRGGRQYDLITMNSRFIPDLAKEGLLAKIDASQVGNLRNVSLPYRDELYGLPERYAIPFNWGSLGIIVRPDLVKTPVTRWSHLWDERFKGKVGIWKEEPREIISLTLKMLGFSANSEDPAQLDAALVQLKNFRWDVVFLENYAEINARSPLSSGDLLASIGYAEEVWTGREEGLQLEYVYPEEGALLWEDTFILSAKAQNPAGAYAFLNFILRPEISALITNQNYYAARIELARQFIDPELLNDPVVFPSADLLTKAEMIRPLSAKGEALYQDVWNQFLATPRE